MLTVRVLFLHGVLRAESAEDLAMTGQEQQARGEWPPSPARLFSALVAAAGTGARCAHGDCSELDLLEAADPPQIFADPREDVLSSPVLPRFVVVDARHVNNQTRMTDAVHEYIARTSATVRPGARMSPKHPEVTYVWPAVEPSDEQWASLAFRAARIGYLGSADSPARVTVSSEPHRESAARLWCADDKGSLVLPVPYPGFRKVLDQAFEQWLTGPTRRAWLPTRLVRYAAPDESPTAAQARPTVFWFLLDPPIAGRFVLPLTETLRATTLDLYQRFLGEAPPAIVHGHGFVGSGRNHAHFLALPNVGFSHSAGHIHGVAVWLPADASPEVIANVRTALAHLEVLVRPGLFETAVRSYGGEQRPVAAQPRRWTRPSKRWVSALPVVHERWSAKAPTRAEVERWFHHAGFDCSVVAFRSSRAPLLTGSIRLLPEQVHRQGHSRHPYSFFEVELDRKIAGPVVIGRGRQFGMGLMAPGG